MAMGQSAPAHRENVMARKIQPQPGRPEAGLRSFLGHLACAIFWLIVAAVLPIRELLGALPELAPHAGVAPILFYALALWSFVRAVRVLHRLAAGRPASPMRPKSPHAAPAKRPDAPKPARSASGLPVTRTPTVQRMR
jgi:hypothetical protein